MNAVLIDRDGRKSEVELSAAAWCFIRIQSGAKVVYHLKRVDVVVDGMAERRFRAIYREEHREALCSCCGRSKSDPIHSPEAITAEEAGRS